LIVGHLGIALGVRARWRDTPLLPLFAASILPDLVDGPIRVLQLCSPFGLYSHSLPAVAILATIAAAAAFVFTRSRTTALVFALVVALHLPADYITGQKILWADGPIIGLFVYRWPLIDFFVELPIIAAGWYLHRRRATMPPWVLTGLALAAFGAGQALADYRSWLHGPHTPNECEAAELQRR